MNEHVDAIVSALKFLLEKQVSKHPSSQDAATARGHLDAIEKLENDFHGDDLDDTQELPTQIHRDSKGQFTSGSD
jgi:hypothetical protein